MHRGDVPVVGAVPEGDDCLDEHLQLPVATAEIEDHHHVIAGQAAGPVSFAFCLNPFDFGR